jgi:hypothetical protein
METLQIVRRILLITVVSAIIGVEIELVLLDHVKPIMQLIPVLLMATALFAIAWYGFTKSRESVKAFQILMILSIAAGLLGIFVHLGFSATDAVKKDKTLQGFPLIRAALTGVAPPFAPAALIQIGLVGVAYTFRHPALIECRGQQ